MSLGKLEHELERSFGRPMKIVCLLHAEAGVYYHASTEEIFMLEGDLVINGEVYGAGDYIRSDAGTIHDPHTETGSMFFICTSLDNEILN